MSNQLHEDAEAFDRGALFVEWLGALAEGAGESEKAADCAAKAADLRALADLYRTADDAS